MTIAEIREFMEQEHSKVKACLDKGKGTYGTASYVRDDTWNTWWTTLHIYSNMLAMIKEDEANERKKMVGQRVILTRQGGVKEIGTVVPSETGDTPFDIWVFSPSKGYTSCYAFSSIKPLPNGEL